jgi:hypothetical protein
LVAVLHGHAPACAYAWQAALTRLLFALGLGLYLAPPQGAWHTRVILLPLASAEHYGGSGPLLVGRALRIVHCVYWSQTTSLVCLFTHTGIAVLGHGAVGLGYTACCLLWQQQLQLAQPRHIGLLDQPRCTYDISPASWPA